MYKHLTKTIECSKGAISFSAHKPIITTLNSIWWGQKTSLGRALGDNENLENEVIIRTILGVISADRLYNNAIDEFNLKILKGKW